MSIVMSGNVGVGTTPQSSHWGQQKRRIEDDFENDLGLQTRCIVGWQSKIKRHTVANPADTLKRVVFGIGALGDA